MSVGKPRRDASSRVLDRCLRECLPFARRSLARLGVAPHDLDDATQDVLVIVARRNTPVVPSVPRAWVFGIARNVARNYKKLATRRARRVAAAAVWTASSAQVATMDDVEVAWMADWLLADLPRAQIDLLFRVAWHGTTIRDAAEELGIPPNTAYSRVRILRSKLADRLASFESSIDIDRPRGQED